MTNAHLKQLRRCIEQFRIVSGLMSLWHLVFTTPQDFFGAKPAETDKTGVEDWTMLSVTKVIRRYGLRTSMSGHRKAFSIFHGGWLITDRKSVV